MATRCKILFGISMPCRRQLHAHARSVCDDKEDWRDCLDYKVQSIHQTPPSLLVQLVYAVHALVQPRKSAGSIPKGTEMGVSLSESMYFSMALSLIKTSSCNQYLL